MADLSGVVEVEDLVTDDSFVDGQQNVQQGSQTLERVRSLLGSAVSVDPVDPASSSLPSSTAGHQRPLHTLFVSPDAGSSQSRLRFNPLPNVSSRGARSASGMPPRNDSRTGRRGPPAGRQPPAEEPDPWFPRHLGEQMMSRVDQIFDLLSSRDEWSYGEQRDFAYSRWRSPVEG